MQLSIKEKLIVHIAYRQIFSAPVRIDSLQKWICSTDNELSELKNAIDDLVNEELISKKDGLLCVKGHEHSIHAQPEKDRLTKTLIEKGRSNLLHLAKIPFIRYIGISGSVAANNPVGNKAGKHKDFVDLDLFVICNSHCLWFLFLVERIVTNVLHLLKGHHFLCFNYVTDETFLEVFNKNFFTATEINNLKTVYDDGVFESFLSKNDWSKKYYPAKNVTMKSEDQSKLPWSVFLAPINYLFFVFYRFGRVLKWRQLSPIAELTGNFDPTHRGNLRRISNPNGGYQEAIKQRFNDILRGKFSNYYSIEIVNNLFPLEGSFKFAQKSNVLEKRKMKFYSKYVALDTNEENSF